MGLHIKKESFYSAPVIFSNKHESIENIDIVAFLVYFMFCIESVLDRYVVFGVTY